MNAKIKTIFLSSVFSLLAGLAASAVSFSANAQPTHDCTDGCYIITCADGGNCSVWYCHGGSGCVMVGSFQQPAMNRQGVANSEPFAESHGAKSSVTRVAYATVCPNDKRCDLYRLAASKATVVGSFDNVNGVIKSEKARDQKNQFE